MVPEAAVANVIATSSSTSIFSGFVVQVVLAISRSSFAHQNGPVWPCVCVYVCVSVSVCVCVCVCVCECV